MTGASRTLSEDIRKDGSSNAAPSAETRLDYRFGHFPQLDGFRGLAVLFVVVAHLLESAGYDPIPTAIGHAFATSGVFLYLS